MLDRSSLIKLIEQLRNFEGSEEDEDAFLEKLEDLVTDPNISDYIYWTDMSPEEIADKYHKEFKEVFEKMNFDYDIYTKTSKITNIN